MNEKELAEIEAMTGAAAPGPWTNPFEHDAENNEILDANGNTVVGVIYCDGIFLYILEPEAKFISRSRTIVPALIAEVRRLRAVLAEYADRDNWVSMMPGSGKYVWYPSENGMDGYTRAEEVLKGDK